MTETLYDVHTGWIAGLLLACMLAAMALGHRLGLRGKDSPNAAAKEHVNAIQGSILGILALLLGFTFSLALQRFDNRSEAVVDEANAIGTALLRVKLLPAPAQAAAQAELRHYLDLRVQASQVHLADATHRQVLLAQAEQVQTTLWDQAAQVAADPARATTLNLYLQALNDMFDAYGKRNAALARHVPEVVLWLLLATFLMAGAIVGYASGVNAHRPSWASYLLVLLIVLLVFLILDLDRPRRGLIQVSQQSLLDLQAANPARPEASAP